jgi:N-acetylmuramoyl-L-alanine amidase
MAVVAALLLVGQAGFGRASPQGAVTVRWGDTLWDLSRRYGVSMDQLASVNHMQVSDVLYAGRSLDIPDTAPDDGPTATTPAATPKSASAGPAAAAPSPISPSPSSTPAAAAAALAEARRTQRTFCDTYQPPTGSSPLPASLGADPARLALRPLFVKWAHVFGVPADLMEAEAWQESGWSNDVVSAAGARGIGQILPATATFINQTLGTHLKLSVPSDNIEMMAAFLGYLVHATSGQVCGAVAAYFQGLGALQRVGVLPVSQQYVRNVLSLRPRFR